MFKNTFSDIEYILTSCAANGTRFEFECYDISHLYNLAHFVDRGLVKGPFFVQSVFGLLGGIGAHPEDLAHMKRTADRLFGNDFVWSILGAGRNQIPMGTLGVAQGSNVRVGLEDSLWIEPGKLAESSAAQVTKVRQIIEGLDGDCHPGRGACRAGAQRARQGRILTRLRPAPRIGKWRWSAWASPLRPSESHRLPRQLAVAPVLTGVQQGTEVADAYRNANSSSTTLLTVFHALRAGGRPRRRPPPRRGPQVAV